MVGIDEAIAVGDIDELLRWVDRLCDSSEWEELTQLTKRCQQAFEHTGYQLWPVANHASYRLALQAPGRWAAQVLEDGGGRFAFGPLTEVAASSHTWAELAAELQPGPATALFAHERVVRGEDLTYDDLAFEIDAMNIIDLPLKLASWEPQYCVATYYSDRIEDSPPPLTAGVDIVLPAPGLQISDEDCATAFRALVEPWVVGSNGSTHFVAVEGSAESAIAALLHDNLLSDDSPSEHVMGAEVSPGEALRHLAWAGSTGGAHGRRRGAALGRFGAWWVLRALGGFSQDDPLDHKELGEAASELRWILWLPTVSQQGWNIHLAVEDPAEGLAWAFSATDHA